MEPLNFDNHLFRCSSLGAIMTDPREKSPMDRYLDAKASFDAAVAAYASMNKGTKTAQKKLASIEKWKAKIVELAAVKDELHLSETCKTELIKIYIREKYGRSKDISSKYIEKGLAVEEDSITLISRVRKQILFKNDTRLSNEYITGEPDLFVGPGIRLAGEVIDCKSCWDIHTFFEHKIKPVNDEHFYQLQGYGELTGARNLTVAYTLIDTPDVLVNQEKDRLRYRMGILTDLNEDYIKACNEIDRESKFDDIPMEDRLIEQKFLHAAEVIGNVYERIKTCRTWLNRFAEKEAKILVAA
jgi:hypothetical protein